MNKLDRFFISPVVNFLRKQRARIMGIHSLNDNNTAVFVDENQISLKLPKLSYISLFKESQRKIIDRSISFVNRPGAEVLLRNVVCEFYNQGILDRKKSVIDIGAWISDNALVWAKIINPELAKVYAIDPSIDNIVFGRTVCKLNGVENISYHEGICSDVAGVELFFDVYERGFGILQG